MALTCDTAVADRVLVVDDDTYALLILEAQLNHRGFKVDKAHSAPEADALLRREGYDNFVAVISDYWMPGGTGLDLLKSIRAADPTLSVLIVTAEGEKDIVANLLRAGAQGYIEKPVRNDALRDAVTGLVTTTREHRRLRDTASSAVSVGRSQMMLLSRQAAKLGGRLQIFFQPHSEASGDFVSVLPLPNGDYVILASDVSGHDMKAAYQSSYFHGLARGMMNRGADMAAVFHCFNEILLTNWNNEDTVEISLAAFALHAQTSQGQVHSVNAGFPTPRLVDADGWISPLGSEPGSPLGWFAVEPPMERRQTQGGQLFFWSDGLDDLADRLDVDPISLACRLCRDQSAQTAAYTRLAADDVAVVRTSLDPVRPLTEMPVPVLDQQYSGDKAPEINEIQQRCESSIRLALPEIGEEALADVTVCLREALINALRHGCAGKRTEWARAQAVLDFPTRTLRVKVSDSGPGHDFNHVNHELEAAEKLLTEHRGLVMIKNIPKRTYFSGNGSIVTMEFLV